MESQRKIRVFSTCPQASGHTSAGYLKRIGKVFDLAQQAVLV